MSRLMRMTYGHGSNRLRRVHVCVGHVEPRPEPLWLRLAFAVVLLAVPVVVWQYDLPAPPQRETLFDVGRLALQPLIEAPPQPRTPAPRQLVEVPRPPEPDQAPQQTIPVQEASRPAITRPMVPGAPDEEPVTHLPRRRVQAEVEPRLSTAPPVRRAAPAEQAVVPTAGIERSRQPVASELATGTRGPAAVRRTPAPDAPPQAPVAHRPVRGTLPSGDHLAEGPAPSGRRERVKGARDAEQAAVPLSVRGISLANLEICSGSQQEEDLVKAILRVVGPHDSCRSDKGTFEFIATRRVSSFNLIIYPGNGRKPSNRCEELEHAYRCLTKTR